MYSRARQFILTEAWPPPLRRVPLLARTVVWFGLGSALGGLGLVLRREPPGPWFDDGLLLLTLTWPFWAAVLLLLDFGLRRVLAHWGRGRRSTAKTTHYEFQRASRLMIGSGAGLLAVGLALGFAMGYDRPEAVVSLAFGVLLVAAGALLRWRYRPGAKPGRK